MSQKLLPGPGTENLLDGERIERVQTLVPGYYWRAKKALTIGEEKWVRARIPKGCVLLLMRIKRVDEKPHAVELAGHPLLHGERTTFDFTVHDFLNKFDPEPDGQAVRQREMAAIQADIAAQQTALLDVRENPAALLEELRALPALPAPKDRGDDRDGLPTVPFNPAAGLPGEAFRPSSALADLARDDVEKLKAQAANQAIVARTRAAMISKRTAALAETVSQLKPFYAEMGAVAIAQSQDAIEVYKKLQSGLSTLGLYTGEDVQVTPIRGGAGAPPETMFHVFQGLTFMDEESLINVEEGGAGAERFPEFVEVLAKDDALLARLIPTPRGIIAMRYRREKKDHGKGVDGWVAARIDIEDEVCFLIVRDGERVHAVHSSIQKVDRLFPSQADLDAPFERRFGWWEGVESERITVEDVKFSDARSKFDNLVLHYRRLLILLAGLVDRQPEVLGEIAALGARSGLAMLALDVQKAIFKPVSDEEFALGSGRPGFWKWVEEKNAFARSGSRLLCNWMKLMTSTTAPGAVKQSRGGRYETDYFVADVPEKRTVAIARREGQSVVVDCPVGRKYSDQVFNARVDVSAFGEHGGLGFLCLDAVKPEEIAYYIGTRHERRGYIKYAPMLYEAKRLVEADLAHEAKLRERFRDAIRVSALEVDDEAVSTVIRGWRAAHRGAAVPLDDEEWNAMAKQLWVLAGEGRDRKKVAEDVAAAEGRAPLRLALSGKTRLYLYATSITPEVENLLGAHRWVTRITLEELKTKVSVVARDQVLLPAVDARETVLAEWPGVEKNVDPEVHHPLSHAEVRGLRDLGALASLRAARWLAPRDDETFRRDLDLVKADTRARTSHRSIHHGWVHVPLMVGRGARRDHEEFHVGCLAFRPVDALFNSGTAAQKKLVRAWFRDYYSHPESAIKNLGGRPQFTLIPVSHARHLRRVEIEDSWGAGATFFASRNKLVAEFLSRLERGPALYRNDSAGLILCFDDAIAETLALLRGAP